MRPLEAKERRGHPPHGAGRYSKAFLDSDAKNQSSGNLSVSSRCSDRANPADRSTKDDLPNNGGHHMKRGISSLGTVGALALLLSAAGSSAGRSTTQVQDFVSGDPVEGTSASLVRNENGVALTVHTRGLSPLYAYTVWMVVFESPENCDGDCDLSDLEIPEVDGTAFGPIASGLAGFGGSATFAGHTDPGKTAGHVILGDGTLDNPTTAEIHFVVRCHGPMIPGLLHEQFSTFSGGCPPNTCVDFQFGVFRQ